jgi:acetyltransferase-like isoleucine patch superfamily enzyme
VVADDEVTASPIVLEQNVWIGFDACVLPGVTIGRGSVVGARSVVTADVPAYTVVAGNPARPIRTLQATDRVPPEVLP